jgi:uncharacterized protein (DUF2147 family)
MIRPILFFFISICFSTPTWIANDISGIWVNSDQDAHIKIYSSNGKFYGHVVWMKMPNDSVTGKPQLDKFNKDPNLRSRPIMNLVVLKDLSFDSENQEWNGGTIYNPKSGSTYDVFSKMMDKNTLEMHFYISIPSLGKTFNWTRVKE